MLCDKLECITLACRWCLQLDVVRNKRALKRFYLATEEELLLHLKATSIVRCVRYFLMLYH